MHEQVFDVTCFDMYPCHWLINRGVDIPFLYNQQVSDDRWSTVPERYLHLMGKT